MSTYKLQVHSRDLAIIGGSMASHTGYDLVEYNNNGKVLSISSVDLINNGGQIKFVTQVKDYETVIIDGKTQVWPKFIHFGDISNQKVNQEFAEDNHFCTATLPVADPKAVFNKILFDANFRNALAVSNIDGGAINYQMLGPNCNTWTNYIDVKFLGVNVFNRLEPSTGIINDYKGNDKTFNDCNDANDVKNCALLEEYSQRFFDETSGKDISGVKISIGGTSAENWYCRISDFDIDGKKYTYIYDTDEGNTIKLDNNQNSFIYAEGGDNNITTGKGNDKIYGGSGIDKVLTGSGKDKVYVGAGNDEVNTKDGGAKNDENAIFLGKGSDTFTGGSGEDNVDGGSGFTSDQTVISAADMTDEEGDTNTVHLGAGDDYYTGGKGTDKVWGEADSDIIHGGEGNDFLYGGDGIDFLHGEDGNDIIDGGDGIDFLHGEDGNDIIDGGQGNDYIDGGDGNDVIYAGDQTLVAHTIGGGAGDDYIYAGHGGDDVRGGNGNNTVYLGSGSDKYIGGDDADIVDGGSANFLFTDSKDGSFEYTLSADLSGDTNTIHLGGGNDIYTGGIGKDIVYSGSGNDEIHTGGGDDDVNTQIGALTSDINHIYLGAGSDTFTGGVGIDIVDGGVSEDTNETNTIDLGANNDEYRGGNGIDIVHGGADNDTIWGGGR